MKRIALCGAMTAALLLPAPPANATYTWGQTRASWYTGSRGACGPLIGNYAAHRTLPCGTRVRVSRDGTTITVVIKDRGPYVGGRGLDLSKGAFSELASPRSGVVWVKYRRVTS